MEKVIWVIDDNRNEMIQTQRKINLAGSMRALCLLSSAALERAIQNIQENDSSRISSPSLILIDYKMAEKEDFMCLSMIKTKQALVGVSLFFMVEERSKEIDERCFALGATVVLNKPFSKSDILRMEHTAWQHEVTKSYEKTLQKQANDLRAAREIMRLNKQLEARNELLYQVFGRYFSDDVLEVILDKPEEVTIGGERKDVAVMIADLRGFTSLSEEIAPERVTDLLNLFFERMLEVIQRYHGTVIEFLGDSILAVFGAPLTANTPIMDASKAAIQMQNAMAEVNEYCESHGYELLEMGIGLHCGEVFIGNIGSEKMMRYNVIGKVVNVCSRIESLTVGGQVLISENMYQKIKELVKVGNQMQVQVKGIESPISVYEILAVSDEEKRNITTGEIHLQEVKEKIDICIHPMIGKVVSKQAISARIKKLSEKRMVVAVSEELELFLNVKLMASEPKPSPFFDGVYGKVIGENKGEYTLHITQTNAAFGAFINNVLLDGK